MIEVPLSELVAIKGTRHLWPQEFGQLVARLEGKPEDRTLMGAIADWIDEKAREPNYAKAWRWLARRGDVQLLLHSRPYIDSQWGLEDLPAILESIDETEAGTDEFDTTTIPGLMAVLAVHLVYVKKLVADMEPTDGA